MTYAIDFRGRVALVLGGGTGIGAAIVRAFAAIGATVAFSHYREPAAQAVASDVRATGQRCLDREVDARSIPQIDAFVGAAVEAFGGIDILVYNAGLTDPRPVFEMSEEQWDQTLDINLKGMFFCARRVGMTMAQRGGGGSMVFLSSVHSLHALPDHAHYAASKGGINMLTRSLAAQLAPHGIRVNAVAPGVIYTERAREEQLYDPAAMAPAIPLRRVGRPEDIADTVVYLASDRAAYITGQVIVADGGLTLPLCLPGL